MQDIKITKKIIAVFHYDKCDTFVKQKMLFKK